MRRVFATQSTARIARRLARRLHLTESSEAWPHAMLAIDATPIAYATATARPKTPRPTPPLTAPEPTQLLTEPVRNDTS